MKFKNYWRVESCCTLCIAVKRLSVSGSVVRSAAILEFESLTDLIAAESESKKCW